VTTTPRRLRVLIVDDSAVQRQILSGLLTKDPSIEIAGYATNGAEAIAAAEQLRPDVITLDEKMPVMSGLDAARQIMRDCPTPIVMIASAGDALIENALAAGVLSVQDKRALSTQDRSAANELLRVVKGMAAVRVVRRRREPGSEIETLKNFATTRASRADIDVVAIGASTGGPQAIRAIVSRLPRDFRVPILVVQHTTAGYADTLVEWLRAETAMPVEVATDGQPLHKAVIYVAPTQQHLVVQGRHLALLDSPPRSLHRPSATVLFESVARAFGDRAVGILLTGMGDDGAAGLLEMKQYGALTIAQDEASSVVFGMPAEAIRVGAADLIQTPQDIAATLIDQLRLRGNAA
jgi:two-component system chemotaxis response regulator CheB